MPPCFRSMHVRCLRRTWRRRRSVRPRMEIITMLVNGSRWLRSNRSRTRMPVLRCNTDYLLCMRRLVIYHLFDLFSWLCHKSEFEYWHFLFLSEHCSRLGDVCSWRRFCLIAAQLSILGLGKYRGYVRETPQTTSSLG